MLGVHGKSEDEAREDIEEEKNFLSGKPRGFRGPGVKLKIEAPCQLHIKFGLTLNPLDFEASGKFTSAALGDSVSYSKCERYILHDTASIKVSLYQKKQ